MNPNNTPALEPPPGVEPDFINPYTIQPILVAISIIALILCAFGIAARSYTRAVLLKQFDFSDWVLVLAGVLFAAFTAIQIVTGEHGQGRHQWNVTQADMAKLLFDLNIIEILYGPTMFCAKYAVLRQIELIFLCHRQKHLAYNVIWALIWMNLIFYGAISMSFMFACVPREKIWNPMIEGRCIDIYATIIATSAINVVSDFTILIVPLVGVWGLQLPPRRKIGAAAVFSVGIFANISSIVRLYYTIEAMRTADLTWAVVPVACWGLAEFTTVILTACFPTFPRLVAQLRKRNPESHCASSASFNKTKKNIRHYSRPRHEVELYEGNSTTNLRGGREDGGPFDI